MFSSNTSQVSSAVNYIEDVFSTYLSTTPGGSYNVTSGIDFTKDGGLVWAKNRTLTSSNYLYGKTSAAGDFVSELVSNTTAAASTGFTFLTALSNGFTDNVQTTASRSLVYWQFRKQAKFFDVVTYTGNGTTNTISHSLGSTPGCIIIKRTNGASSWPVYHRSLTSISNNLFLNTTAAETYQAQFSSVSSTDFVISGGGAAYNQSGGTYVAYLFAHDAGGFGTAGTDNVISCGSYTGNGTGNNPVTLGYEPQFIIIKNASATASWALQDVMRGMSNSTNNADYTLFPNLSNAEQASSTDTHIYPTATGFVLNSASGTYNNNAQTYIYIAIRRGPMKTPTSGTSVFSPIARTGTGLDNQTVTGVGFPPDLSFTKARTDTYPFQWYDRLRGKALRIESNSTGAEINDGSYGVQTFGQNGITYGLSDGGYNTGGGTYINYFLLRAPSFMDVVCYTGTVAASQTYNHNLGVVPEMMIVKSRSNAVNWAVYNSSLGATKYLQLNTDIAATTSSLWWNNTAPTSSVFTVGNGSNTGGSGYTYVAYLFATLAGVSKVGSYTGSGTTKQIDCGFTGGARFVLIKRTDDIGDWYVWDTARGIVSGNDPYLLLNSTAAEVTNTDYIDTYSAGFEISSTAPAAINANGGTFIFLAIA